MMTIRTRIWFKEFPLTHLFFLIGVFGNLQNAYANEDSFVTMGVTPSGEVVVARPPEASFVAPPRGELTEFGHPYGGPATRGCAAAPNGGLHLVNNLHRALRDIAKAMATAAKREEDHRGPPLPESVTPRSLALDGVPVEDSFTDAQVATLISPSASELPASTTPISAEEAEKKLATLQALKKEVEARLEARKMEILRKSIRVGEDPVLFLDLACETLGEQQAALDATRKEYQDASMRVRYFQEKIADAEDAQRLQKNYDRVLQAIIGLYKRNLQKALARKASWAARLATRETEVQAARARVDSARAVPGTSTKSDEDVKARIDQAKAIRAQELAAQLEEIRRNSLSLTEKQRRKKGEELLRERVKVLKSKQDTPSSNGATSSDGAASTSPASTP